jgi:Asp-tRNA(Asn)/Glu-tRNA(Gln) amidotransferase A subunit family amidase
MSYDPNSFRGLTFHDVRPAFQAGADTPRAYLERCMETVAQREPTVQAFAHLNETASRAAADASTERWRSGRPLSPIDGMPIGVKDLLETKDMPTEMNCAILKGNFPKRDNAAVRALREAGAVIFGKTVTAELGGSHPGPTTNPFDQARTPGGSSSGSAAAVAAGMMPAAIGTQVGGSIIRPAGYCGNVALKPSQGAINRGERQATSMSTHGVHANAFEDMWQVAYEIAVRVGGDPGKQALSGPPEAPAAMKPATLIVLETAGWPSLDARTVDAFELLLERLAAAGIRLLRRAASPEARRLEDAIAEAARICVQITGWENRWGNRNLADMGEGAISARALAVLEAAERMTPADYQAALADRAAAQAAHAEIGGVADAAISLSCPGPASLWAGDAPGEPLARRPTGDAIFNYPSSMLFAPVVTAPMLSVGGMPVGAQVIGLPHQDAHMAAIARWIRESIPPVSA